VSVPGDAPLAATETFRGAFRAYGRVALPLTAMYALFILPIVGLFALAAPTLAGSMFGRTPLEIPPGEWLAFAGIVLLSLAASALVTTAVAEMSDRALAGEAVPSPGRALGDALARVPALAGTYVVLVGIVLLPMLPLFALLAMTTAGAGSGEPPVAAAIGFLLGLLVVLPIVFAVGMYLRFGPVRAAIRDEGAFAAIRGSIALVRGRFWRVTGYMVLVALLAQAVMTAASILGMALVALGPFAPMILYGTALSACVAFQVLQEVALLRRLEDLHAPPAEGDAPADETPAPEPAVPGGNLPAGP
jgi:hypothetical protein